MRSGTMLQLLNDAMQITNKMALMNMREIASDESGFRQEVITLLGYLRALEAVVKQEAVNSKTPQERPEDVDDSEVKKIEKRLRLWSRKPEQINSLILSSFLKLRYEENVNPVPIDRLRERYLSERASSNGGGDSREFDANFWLMRLIGRNNHGKVFDLDDHNNVTIWPKVVHAVERYRKERQIGPC